MKCYHCLQYVWELTHSAGRCLTQNLEVKLLTLNYILQFTVIIIKKENINKSSSSTCTDIPEQLILKSNSTGRQILTNYISLNFYLCLTIHFFVLGMTLWWMWQKSVSFCHVILATCNRAFS